MNESQSTRNSSTNTQIKRPEHHSSRDNSLAMSEKKARTDILQLGELTVFRCASRAWIQEPGE